MKELLPCPFCGDKPMVSESGRVWCFNSSRMKHDAEAANAEEWNLRALAAPAPAASQDDK